MRVNAVQVGTWDKKRALWIVCSNNRSYKLATFEDEDAYQDFIVLVRAGYLTPKSLKRVPEKP